MTINWSLQIYNVPPPGYSRLFYWKRAILSLDPSSKLIIRVKLSDDTTKDACRWRWSHHKNTVYWARGWNGKRVERIGEYEDKRHSSHCSNRRNVRPNEFKHCEVLIYWMQAGTSPTDASERVPFNRKDVAAVDKDPSMVSENKRD